MQISERIQYYNEIYNLNKIIFIFMLWGFCGWLYETLLYSLVINKKFTNRGFLHGPILPIYGVGAIAIVNIIHSIDGYTWKNILIISCLGSAALEYTTSWLLEKIFHAVWWEYHSVPFNINGRISIPTTMCFGILGLLVLYIIDPFINYSIQFIDERFINIFSIITSIIFIIDLTLTVTSLLEFKGRMTSLVRTINTKIKSIKLTEIDSKLISDSISKIIEYTGWLSKQAIARIKIVRYNSSKLSINVVFEEIKNRILNRANKIDKTQLKKLIKSSSSIDEADCVLQQCGYDTIDKKVGLLRSIFDITIVGEISESKDSYYHVLKKVIKA